MDEEMKFPNIFEEFVNEYSFVDRDEVYTNGCELIPTFRVMQGYEHFVKQIRADAIDLIDRHLWNYSHEVWEDFKPILEQLKENNND